MQTANSGHIFNNKFSYCIVFLCTLNTVVLNVFKQYFELYIYIYTPVTFEVSFIRLSFTFIIIWHKMNRHFKWLGSEWNREKRFLYHVVICAINIIIQSIMTSNFETEHIGKYLFIINFQFTIKLTNSTDIYQFDRIHFRNWISVIIYECLKSAISLLGCSLKLGLRVIM